jgi:predicted ATP-grasp superfamily ATP-dependent carboligase
MKSGVIVLGGHIQGLNIVRIYGKIQIDVVLIDKDRLNLAKHSKYCKKFYHTENFLELLLEFKQKEKYKNWLIVPTNDFQVKILSQNRDILDEHFLVTTDRWEIISNFYNKINTYKLAKELNIPIPWTLFPKSIEDLKEDNIKYPCIIKPAIMHTFYSQFKKKVFVCKDREELIQNYKKAISVIPKSEIIIQEIIEGDSTNQYSACFYYNKNKSHISLVARRTRQHPPDFGNATTFAETVNIPILKDMAEKILKRVKYHGLCEVEFKYDKKTKEYKLLEINPRTWKWHSIANRANTPFLISIYKKMVYGEDLIIDGFKEAYFKHILLDTIMLIINKNYRKNYKKPPKDKIQYAVFDINDILPFFFELIYFPYNLIKR